jgi:hypothetical protein
VQPWKDFISKGWITSLKVEFSPLGVHIVSEVQTSLKKENDPATGIPIGDAKNRIIEAGLWTPKGSKAQSSKIEGALPKKSLVKSDFEADKLDKLPDRVKAVALSLGDTTARGRIGSLKLMAEGVDDFDKWWKKASGKSKARLLTDSKHFETLTDVDFAAMAERVTQCPFRGPVPTPAPEGSDEDGDPIPPQKGREKKASKGKSKA